MELPDRKFFLFGMGHRRKLLYKDGVLSALDTGEILGQWDVASERIFPEEYTVSIETKSRDSVSISEDEGGIWLHEESFRRPLDTGPLRLPRFDEHWHGPLLRSLHHEILINMLPAGPVPNLLVYDRPWYRDAAMVCMCLERTGNLALARDWVLSLTEPFDCNNGNPEPDNLGQVLYLISLCADASHPLVEKVLDTVPEYRRGDHIVGITDGAEHPVYQTKWLKLGLRSLGLEDPYRIPDAYDSYSALFWMDYREAHVQGPPISRHLEERYPYLAWAEAHFGGHEPPAWALRGGYPYSWEAEASKAHYARMAPIGEEYVERRIAVPHSWHAAEMFLYLLNKD